MRLKLESGIERAVTVYARSITVISATMPVYVVVENANGDESFTLYQGVTYRSENRFDRIRFTSETTQTIDVEIVSGELIDNRINGQVDTFVREDCEAVALDDLVFTTNIEILIGTSDRKELLLRAHKNNRGTIHPGATSEKGFYLEAGESLVLSVSEGVTFYGTDLGDVLHITEVVKR